MGALYQDVRFALRLSAKTPGITAKSFVTTAAKNELPTGTFPAWRATSVDPTVALPCE